MSAFLSDFHLLRPLWLLGTLPCALLLFILWQRQRGLGSWQQVIDPELLAPLSTSTPVQRRQALPFAATALAWLIALIALAGPTWERLPQPSYRSEDALLLLLDLSPSMYAQDVSPSRLELARREIRDALRLRQQQGGTTALIAYSGDAHVVSPTDG